MSKIDVGKVVNVRGVRGEMKILPHSNVENLFSKLKKVYIGDELFKIKQAKLVKNCAAITVEGVDTPEKAREYVHKTVFAEEADMPETNKDEYYIKDIIGINVYDMQDNMLGVLSQVYFTGANDVYEITCENGEKALIPAVKQFVKSVNMKEKKMIIEPIEGMIP